MSLRATAPTPPRAARPPRAEASTGCGGNVAFGGAVIPCGFLIGTNSLADTFIVTSKSKGQLDVSGSRLVMAMPDTQTTNQIATMRAMNSSLKTSIYRNVFSYAVGIQTDDYDGQNELSAMGAVEWKPTMATEAAFDAVKAACVDAYGVDCAVTAFRKL